MKCTNPFPKLVSGSDKAYLILRGVKPKYVYLPCGKCLACRINRTREWTKRLIDEEIKASSATFITLTYDNDHLSYSDGFPVVNKRHIQDYLRRLRRAYPDVKIRYFINSEYGPTTLRPHYHGIVYNLPSSIYDDAKHIKRPDGTTSYWSPSFERIWSNGDVEFSPLCPEKAGYVAKYFIDRKDVDERLVPNFSLMSRKPGIGFSAIEDYKEKVRYYNLHTLIGPSGLPVRLPRYYKNKIYSDEERKQIYEDYIKSMPDMSDEDFNFLKNAESIEDATIRIYKFLHPKSKKI